MSEFFSYDHDDGIEFHATKADARARAEHCLEQDRDVACEGWPDGVEWICYGRVLGRVVETFRRPATPEDHLSGCDLYIDYQLLADCDAVLARVAELEARTFSGEELVRLQAYVRGLLCPGESAELHADLRAEMVRRAALEDEVHELRDALAAAEQAIRELAESGGALRCLRDNDAQCAESMRKVASRALDRAEEIGDEPTKG